MQPFHLILGNRLGWDSPVPFGLGLDDLRRHLYVVGQTGVGKSTLLKNLLIQHIAAGHGVGLIDPHGDLAEEFLAHIPSHRARDLCYFNPGDLENPPAFNPLDGVPPDQRHLAASGIVGAFRSLWADSWGPRLEYILHHAVAALLECPGSTLLWVNRLLTDPTFRERILRQVHDPFLRDFWINEYNRYDPRFQREAIAPIQNKLGQFLQSPAIRHILGQAKSRIDLPFLMDRERIFIANLSKGRLGHDKANLLGSLLVNQFQLAAMARATQPETERKDFHLFVDEFQNFATDAFASILAEARKYRLCLTLSHQYLDQVALPIRQAVFGNVGSLLAFRVGHDDAHALQRQFGDEFQARQFVELGRFQLLAKILENGEPSSPFRASSLPAEASKRRRVSKHIKASKQRFTRPRSDVSRMLNRWIGGIDENL